eukprot:CAMPEP_0206128690 /NCGR_PEP_ID=MMETSP1472-20131121/33083_1 /ASSEMBLY_ACC=CAM_ASM_001108 /TAXON_ID=41880 /ORGANISM="Pycnococcus provasolii, Strain RCC251" /LENGTH=70 /DNA_ID=CAMNT_0053519901 /DNA_START=73 /DNA_END=281 /DNA_ORIENTATION=-
MRSRRTIRHFSAAKVVRKVSKLRVDGGVVAAKRSRSTQQITITILQLRTRTTRLRQRLCTEQRKSKLALA